MKDSEPTLIKMIIVAAAVMAFLLFIAAVSPTLSKYGY